MEGIPPSRRIADDLRRAILAGELAPGDRLPSERTLASTYAAARNTARQAIALLEAEGLVEAQHGRGVFVRKRRLLRRFAHDRYARRHRDAGKAPFRAEAEAQGFQPRVEVIRISRVKAPAAIADRLALKAGERVLLRENRYFANEQPVQLANTYIPLTIAQGTSLTRAVPGPGGIYAALEESGHTLGRMLEDVSARMPLPYEAALLHLGKGTPVLELIHTSFDQRGEPIEVTQSILPADRSLLTFELPVT